MNLTRSWAMQLESTSDSTKAEVSQLLDEPVRTIESRIRSGLTKLRFALTDEGNP
jgi:DNA-directed RNA polymerase specialized sigma24 family protein